MDGFEWSRDCKDFVSLTTPHNLQPQWWIWYVFNRGAACFTSYWLCNVSEATVFKGKQKASVAVLLPHGLTPYGPASHPQVRALLAIPQSVPESKGDPALAISAPPAGMTLQGKSQLCFYPQLVLFSLALVTWHQSCMTPCHALIENTFFFPGHWTWQWIRRKLYQSYLYALTAQFPYSCGINLEVTRQLLLLLKVLAAGLVKWGGTFPLRGKDKTSQ